MVELKFYQPEELIKQFLQSWHIQDAQTVAHIQQLARPHFASLPDLYSFLKKYVLNQVPTFVQSLSLPHDQAFSLIQLIYVHEKIYEEINLFHPALQAQKLEQLLFLHQPKYALPPEQAMRMKSQNIQMYHPFKRIYQFFSKAISHVFHRK